MNEATARLLAKHSRTYSARRIKGTCNWMVWCSASDHYVEFDPEDILRVSYEAATKRHPMPLNSTIEQD